MLPHEHIPATTRQDVCPTDILQSNKLIHPSGEEFMLDMSDHFKA